ncbi:MAG: hypothetical protein KDA17_05820 [Candidatus Saccharibacteria bacterium]|nr:hypothetical protein [Candidatus Saccharibacteria bacterium]
MKVFIEVPDAIFQRDILPGLSDSAKQNISGLGPNDHYIIGFDEISDVDLRKLRHDDRKEPGMRTRASINEVGR